jgi:DNA polymerase III epsilon subunit-like protein
MGAVDSAMNAATAYCAKCVKIQNYGLERDLENLHQAAERVLRYHGVALSGHDEHQELVNAATAAADLLDLIKTDPVYRAAPQAGEGGAAA